MGKCVAASHFLLNRCRRTCSSITLVLQLQELCSRFLSIVLAGFTAALHLLDYCARVIVVGFELSSLELALLLIEHCNQLRCCHSAYQGIKWCAACCLQL